MELKPHKDWFWQDACVAITGITGSLGTALSKELLLKKYGLARLVGISRKWQDQEKLSAELGNDPRLRLFIGDVRDVDRLRMALVGVDYVIHAAAIKSLPACQYNPVEAIATNIIGTENVLQASLDCGVRKVAVISSDKASQAGINIYGVTKAAAENLAVAYNSYSANHKTRYSAFRYGNVWGSSGSVVPLFISQRDSGKLTLTHPKMSRFWIKMEDAVAFILRGVEAMVGGEIFVPHLSSSRIIQLARAIAPEAEIEIIGIRSGEKLHETMIVPEEAYRTKDVGWAYRIEPQFKFWDSESGYMGGSSVPIDWTYSSASATSLSDDALKVMLK